MKVRATHCPSTSCRPSTANGLACCPETIASTSPLSASQFALATRSLSFVDLLGPAHRHSPDVAGILPDRAVRGEPAHMRRVPDSHGIPFAGVVPEGIHVALRLGIRVKIAR